MRPRPLIRSRDGVVHLRGWHWASPAQAPRGRDAAWWPECERIKLVGGWQPSDVRPVSLGPVSCLWCLTETYPGSWP